MGAITRGMRSTLPEGGRALYRIGPRMRDVLAVLVSTGGTWRGSQRALCRAIAREEGVGWRTVAFSVASLREMGLVQGPPYALSPAGERLVRRLFRGYFERTGAGMQLPGKPLPEASSLRPARRAAPSPPPRRPTPAPQASSPRTVSPGDALTGDEARCWSCGFDSMMLLPESPRRGQCRRCGAVRALG